MLLGEICLWEILLSVVIHCLSRVPSSVLCRELLGHRLSEQGAQYQSVMESDGLF